MLKSTAAGKVQTPPWDPPLGRAGRSLKLQRPAGPARFSRAFSGDARKF